MSVVVFATYSTDPNDVRALQDGDRGASGEDVEGASRIISRSGIGKDDR